MKANSLSRTRSGVWLRFGLLGLVFFGMVAVLLALNTAPAEAAPEITLKSKDKLFVYADGCTIQVLKQPANQQFVQLGCELFTPTASNASSSDRTFAPTKRYDHIIKGGEKYNVRADGTCNLKITLNTAQQVNIKCKPKPAPPTVAPTRKPTLRDGLWNGTTSQSRPVSFKVAGGGASLNTFKVHVLMGGCLFELRVSGPVSIQNKEIQLGGQLPSPLSGTLVYKGKFTSENQFAGTWSANGAGHPSCGYLTEDGTWSTRWSSTGSSPETIERADYQNEIWQVTSISR
jgi:hypothetical protein